MNDKNSRQRELKNRIRVSTSIDKELNEKFELLSKETRIPKSKLFDMAIELLLKDMSNQ
ncbi:ribbon-helix-helix domain-containing protein [Terrisporobacter petrolearius]|uniref:ribbon-helix-helix domain-containing protein n=1 Tax=Terrisporobacter petrolearius TaxID=1460447 RepID=UPI0022E046C4|nr:ribbon-helix-helix domain-containing protein [Terrisporobacter petrolearius]